MPSSGGHPDQPRCTTFSPRAARRTPTEVRKCSAWLSPSSASSPFPSRRRPGNTQSSRETVARRQDRAAATSSAEGGRWRTAAFARSGARAPARTRPRPRSHQTHPQSSQEDRRASADATAQRPFDELVGEPREDEGQEDSAIASSLRDGSPFSVIPTKDSSGQCHRVQGIADQTQADQRGRAEKRAVDPRQGARPNQQSRADRRQQRQPSRY